jgi:hypothetical protein
VQEKKAMQQEELVQDSASNGHLTRLAERGWVAVDLCRCGCLHVHIGTLTLRLSRESVSALMTTLGEALAHERAARRAHSEQGVCH